MINKIIGKVLNNNEYKLSALKPIVNKINLFETDFEKLTDDEIKSKTAKWQKELRSPDYQSDSIEINAKLQKRLNEILPEAYALVREAGKRAMNQRIRDVQMMGAITLHQGKIAEQKTGEGKTLTAIPALYLNSLTGKGSHLVTPNDYLSKIAPGWYGPLFDLLGVKVGVIASQDASFIFDPEFNAEGVEDKFTVHLMPVSRRDAYLCDITYGTNHEFGFDYLYDNRAKNKNQIVQVNPLQDYGEHYFAIVDEVDNILVDIARTPLIISSAKELKPEMYYEFARLADTLVQKTDYTVDEKEKIVTLTELGISKIERKLGIQNLYEKDFQTIFHIECALRAKALMLKDKDYVVKNGEVVIVDQNTGRLLFGNRWSDGLHQAVEAKENVKIQSESKTIATISYQNYFRLYKKLAGMTGTATTEADEFMKMYSLDVVAIPTFKKVARTDQPDIIYKTEAGKFRSIAKDIQERNIKGQPVLVGTTSVDKSQLLSSLLKRMNIKHEVLNAKNHETEAAVIAKAGLKGAVTVSTNMAGRGVDIILGGKDSGAEHDEVVSLGGLFVIGTERHDSRRIDNQLRGRSGRQGDVGESRFYLSLQDELLRIFGGETISKIMATVGIDDNTPLESRIISRTIESAQKKVEGINFDQRRATVQYDDVMNIQRNTIYKMRRMILFAENIDEFLEWVLLKTSQLGIKSEDGTVNQLDLTPLFNENIEKFSKDVWFEVVKRVVLEVTDVLWTDHIDAMDDLRYSVRLRGYGQVDPLIEYKKEGKSLFERLLQEIWMAAADRLSKIEVTIEHEQAEQTEAQNATDLRALEQVELIHGEFESGVHSEAKTSDLQDFYHGQATLMSPNSATATTEPKIGRNDLCPCGSGKKFKKCHGR